MVEVQIGKTYKHFKGQLVKVLLLAKHTETEECMVIYEHLDTHEIWARPYFMFCSLVDHDKYPDIKQKYLFEIFEEML